MEERLRKMGIEADKRINEANEKAQTAMTMLEQYRCETEKHKKQVKKLEAQAEKASKQEAQLNDKIRKTEVLST